MIDNPVRKGDLVVCLETRSYTKSNFETVRVEHFAIAEVVSAYRDGRVKTVRFTKASGAVEVTVSNTFTMTPSQLPFVRLLWEAGTTSFATKDDLRKAMTDLGWSRPMPEWSAVAFDEFDSFVALAKQATLLDKIARTVVGHMSGCPALTNGIDRVPGDGCDPKVARIHWVGAEVKVERL